VGLCLVPLRLSRTQRFASRRYFRFFDMRRAASYSGRCLRVANARARVLFAAQQQQPNSRVGGAPSATAYFSTTRVSASSSTRSDKPSTAEPAAAEHSAGAGESGKDGNDWTNFGYEYHPPFA
jgi:hypothetical protein